MQLPLLVAPHCWLSSCRMTRRALHCDTGSLLHCCSLWVNVSASTTLAVWGDGLQYCWLGQQLLCSAPSA